MLFAASTFIWESPFGEPVVQSGDAVAPEGLAILKQKAAAQA
jgi:hypothetical protein